MPFAVGSYGDLPHAEITFHFIDRFAFANQRDAKIIEEWVLRRPALCIGNGDCNFRFFRVTFSDLLGAVPNLHLQSVTGLNGIDLAVQRYLVLIRIRRKLY